MDGPTSYKPVWLLAVHVLVRYTEHVLMSQKSRDHGKTFTNCT